MAKDTKSAAGSGSAVNAVSGDLLWEIVRHQNSYLVKRNTGGGIRFSRDPFNVGGVHTRKHAGFINDKAVGIAPTKGGDASKGGVTLVTKKGSHANKPASHTHTTSFAGSKAQRKLYKSIVNVTVKNSYRSDLRESAVARASQIRKSQRPVKEHRVSKERKPRGKKAQKAAREAAAASEE